MAGLLTCSGFGHLPVQYSGDNNLPKLLQELTAAGLSRNYTWFPFHSPDWIACGETNAATKI
jgi:hypothetical protein